MGAAGDWVAEIGADLSGPNPAADSVASAFEAVLDALLQRIPTSLIDEAGRAGLRAAAGGLPVDPGAVFGFALRLGEPAAEADFFAAMPPGSALARHYIRHGRGAAPDSIAAALGEHLAATGPGAPGIESLGVEYDIMPDLPGAPPGLLARLWPDSAKVAAADAAAWLAGAAGWRLAEGERVALGWALEGLAAAGGLVSDIRIMPGRPGRAFRIVSRAMESMRALAVLERLCWEGPAGEAASFLDELSGLFAALRLAFGLTGDGVAPRIGFELFQDEPGRISHPGIGAWAPVLARLCEDGVCLPEKMEGLLAWPGRELVLSGPDRFGLLTGLSHIELSFESTPYGPRSEARACPAAAYLPFEAIGPRFAAR